LRELEDEDMEASTERRVKQGHGLLTSGPEVLPSKAPNSAQLQWSKPKSPPAQTCSTRLIKTMPYSNEISFTQGDLSKIACIVQEKGKFP
jgi:hypothetical protein